MGIAHFRIIRNLALASLAAQLQAVATPVLCLPQIKVERLQHYFSTYKLVPGKEINIKVDHVYGRDEALRVIAAAEKDYWNHYGHLHKAAKAAEAKAAEAYAAGVDHHVVTHGLNRKLADVLEGEFDSLAFSGFEG